MHVAYASGREAWTRFDSRLVELIGRDGVTTVCEIGGGANPALSLETVRENDLEYLVVDISAEELAKAPAGYRTLVADVAASGVELPDQYDLVFSRMVVEHVSRPADFHRSILEHLRPEGIAFHFFPTLYTLPYLVNRVLPESLARRLLEGAGGGHEKFPAYYRWCRGPSIRQQRRFESVGYDVEEYVGFFGHDYYRKVRSIQHLNDVVAAMLVRHPVPLVTSYAQVLLRRPGTEDPSPSRGLR